MLLKNKDDYKIVPYKITNGYEHRMLVKKSTIDNIPDDLIQDWDEEKYNEFSMNKLKISVSKPLNKAEKEIRQKIKEMALN